MPRQGRKKSTSGIYHIMLRGINHQSIFEDEEDNIKFLDVIAKNKTVSGYKILSYCLMGNHVHLLLKEGHENLEKIFKRLGGKFVYWYNSKYKRNGHLFQDRFKSEAVESDMYILTVVRYIHQNPQKAGMVNATGDYPYSSYMEYINPQVNQITDIDIINGMISKDEFIEFHKKLNMDECLEMVGKSIRMTDEQAKEIITKISNCKNTAEFQALDLVARNENLKTLREEGLSIRQLSRLTGVSIGLIRKM